MPGRWAYNILYRLGAARLQRGWDKGAGPELVELVESGRITPPDRPGPPRAVDLGCGTGANVLFLAERGWDAVGVDFSSAAISRARQAAAALGLADQARFLVGDVSAPRLDGVEGPFDLVAVYNTLQDLLGPDRKGLAALVRNLTEPGSFALVWCYYESLSDLPRFTFNGPSRMFPFVVEPGEEENLFGENFAIERLPRPSPESGKACFLMTRRH
jgi:SAM-dependent methyltransferase